MLKRRLTLWLAIFVSVFLLAQITVAGTGNITGGTPAKLNLSVYLGYDEQTPDNWMSVFNEASKLLYNATEKQIQFGTITVYRNCPGKKETADVLISSGTEGARAHVLGLGRKGTHIFISQTHKSASGGALGQFGITHEAGHYVFGLYDEYHLSGLKPTFTILPSGTPIKNPSEDFFCVSPKGQGRASIMDGGTTVSPNNNRTEFCTRTSGGFSTSHESGYARSKTTKNGVDEGTLYRNKQQLKHGKSAWETIVKVAASKYGITLNMPVSEPVNDTSGHTDLVKDVTWKVEDCTPKTVLVIDRSGSMSGSPIALAKQGASSSIDITETGQYIGVVSFSSSASVNFPLQKIIDNNTKVGARSAISGLSADGATNIGGGLRTALDQIFGTQRTGNETIVLLTDGQHNTGENPSSVLPDLIAAGVKVQGIGLGTGADVSTIQNISNQTGGSSDFVAEAEELPKVMVRLTTEPQGNFIIKTMTNSISVGGQIDNNTFIDSFTTSAIFDLAWTAGDLNLILIRPDGSQVNPNDSNVEFAEETNHEFYRIKSPSTGTWQLITKAINITNPQAFTLQVFDKSLKAQFTAATDVQQVTFPEPVKIRAIVIGDNVPVAGASVSGTVVRPGGSKVDITLFDDGLIGHGDDEANDGVYSNLFARYSGDGAYTFKLSVNNQNGVSAPPDEKGPNFVPWSIAPFQRESTVLVSVLNVPTAIQPGSIQLAQAQNIPSDTTVTTDILDQIILGVTLSAGPKENVMINSMAFNGSGTGNETKISKVKLYIDGDKDGHIDVAGDFALPIVSGSYNSDDGQVVFTDPLMISAGTSVDLLLVYEIKVDTVFASLDPSSKTIWIASIFIPFMGLVGVSLRRKNRFLDMLFVVLLITIPLTLQSCGGGGGGGGGTRTPISSSATFKAIISPSGISATGATSNQSLGISGQAIDSPSLTVNVRHKN